MKSFAPRIACLLALVAATVMAIGSQFGFGSFDPKWVVMMMPEAQKDLNLTKDQKKQIQEITKGAQEAGRDGMSDMGNVMSDMDAKMLAVLTPEQTSRLEELWIQYEGPVVLSIPEVAAKAKLSDEQQTKVKDLWTAFKRSSMDSMMKGRGSMDSMKQMKKQRAETNDATLAMLTDEQKAAFTAMQGKIIKWRAKKEF